MKNMEIIESNLDCSGICKQGLFYMFRPIGLGQPPRSCAIAFKRSYDETFGALSWGLFASIIVAVALLMCACGLFRQKKSR